MTFHQGLGTHWYLSTWRIMYYTFPVWVDGCWGLNQRPITCQTSSLLLSHLLILLPPLSPLSTFSKDSTSTLCPRTQRQYAPKERIYSSSACNAAQSTFMLNSMWGTLTRALLGYTQQTRGAHASLFCPWRTPVFLFCVCQHFPLQISLSSS